MNSTYIFAEVGECICAWYCGVCWQNTQTWHDISSSRNWKCHWLHLLSIMQTADKYQSQAKFHLFLGPSDKSCTIQSTFLMLTFGDSQGQGTAFRRRANKTSELNQVLGNSFVKICWEMKSLPLVNKIKLPASAGIFFAQLQNFWSTFENNIKSREWCFQSSFQTFSTNIDSSTDFCLSWHYRVIRAPK